MKSQLTKSPGGFIFPPGICYKLDYRGVTEIKLTRDLVETNNWGKSERKGNESEAVGEKLLVLNNLKGKILDLEVWLLT